MQKPPVTIEGRYAVKGERQPVIKSWLGLIALAALFAWQVLFRLAH